MSFITVLTLFAVVPVASLWAGWFLARSRDRAYQELRTSEEKFARIFRTSPNAINLASHEQGICLDVNESFFRLFGYTREELIGRSVLPGDLGIWVRTEERLHFLAELKARREINGFEALLRRKDGSTFTALISSALVEIHGKLCNISVTQDIHARKLVEEALRESAQRLELAVQTGNLGIWDRNLEDGSVIWNDGMYELLDLDPASFRPGQYTWMDRVLAEDRPVLEWSMEAVLQVQGVKSQLFRYRWSNGEIRHLASKFRVVRDGEGRPVRLIGVLRDRTAPVRAEEERHRLEEERRHSEKLESLGSLAGGMAHDMNNVLAGILGTAERLRQAIPDGDASARGLDAILHAAGRGRDLVRALTDFARKGLTEPQRFDFNELIRKEVELLNHATLSKVEVRLDLDPGLPKVLGDASALGSTIMNLGVNALDAMPNGGTLTFQTRLLRSGRIEVTVTDTGMGMPPEVLIRAMEPFFTTKPPGQGTGLGLARAYGTMKAHGGTVDIRSTPDLGTTIRLQLPCLPARAAEPAPESRPDRAEAQAGLRILLVDDDPVILETIPPLMESMGHQVSTAMLGQEALTLLGEGLQVDVVVLDHNMPGLTGTETLVRLREQFPDLPVVMATGFADGFTETLVTSLPHVRILNKPYTRAELTQSLAAAMATAALPS